MILENKNDFKILNMKAQIAPAAEESAPINTDELLVEICAAIREGGFNPVSQIVGYIISEDPTHITNYNNARTMMSKIDRDDLLENMVKQYIDHIEKTADTNEANKENG